MSIFKQSIIIDNSDKGYSLIELSVVVAVLATLGSLAIPNILDTLKLNRIEEAKALMNSYAAECLGNYRTMSTEDFSKSSPSSFSAERLETLGYSVEKDANTCVNLGIIPTANIGEAGGGGAAGGENTLYAMGFTIRSSNGQITKRATPATNQSSLKSCRAWAGNACGATEAQKAEWARLAQLDKDKQNCDTAAAEFATAKNSGATVVWDINAQSCTKTAWYFEGQRATSEQGMKDMETAKYGLLCTQWQSEQQAKDPPTTAGPLTKKECGNRKFYFFEGINVGTEAAFEEKKRQAAILHCNLERDKAIKNRYSGLYKGVIGAPGECSVDVWMCDGNLMGDKQAYQDSKCGKKDEEKKIPEKTREELIQECKNQWGMLCRYRYYKQNDPRCKCFRELGI